MTGGSPALSRLLPILALTTALTACTDVSTEAASVDPPAAHTTTTPPPNPADVGANELGLVPVLMYHQISADPAGEYDQTPAEFRDELERLYREGYRPVTVAAYVSGDLDLPAGTHPVVLTFDDSTTSQLAFTETGTVAPDSAAGILAEFGARYPDFRPVATFYVNNEPFRGDPRALPWLVANGHEIGAHTATHPNLSTLDDDSVRREFAENVRAVTAAAPGVTVRTMALPLGIHPDNAALTTSGTWAGTTYTFDAVMLVGSNPAPAPYAGLDPTGVPRIRSGRGAVPFDSAYWLDHLAAHPADRYTADGDPARVSFPRDRGGELNPRFTARANPY
ncbi:polysaccharide deacetylase family protein [Nocardia caishijiensis]|uniref:Peptidoglycan/xylan/chitin deacetylase (PgdA/CDA1 family) n=1 Tax=Nocardia caishijiensis TaxID=184756 RepID=A0ABQ6YF28_9NOCA|nr:polysaccharide deacetylase family protein [Nocardia caishijiensis]KAF0836596.1 peptidoglycan/xylan/chitin deacetylase (PgdA/CDA1 family) [Nocardia caishijiensis]